MVSVDIKQSVYLLTVCCWLLLYIALFSTLKQTHCTRMWFYMSEQLFIACFWISTEVVCLQHWHGWCHMKLPPSRHILCTPYNHVPCHFMQSHVRQVHVYLAVTCHLHFWQNDRGLLRATAVNIKITSRTCRFETCRYLQLPNFKLRLISFRENGSHIQFCSTK